MKFTPLMLLPGLLLSTPLMAECLNRSDVLVYGQLAWSKKWPSRWQIDGKNPYTASNSNGDLAVKYSNGCQLVENRLNLDFSLLGLAYSPLHRVGSFEQDDNRARLLLNRLRLTWTVSDAVRLEAGKLAPKAGMFYLKSPAGLMNNDYAGFKPTRIYEPGMKSAYEETFWGALLAWSNENRALTLTAAPTLTHGGRHYESSSNWSALQRSNTSDRYLLTYTDYSVENHTPSASLRLGNSPSLAVGDSYAWSPQLLFNAEMAVHRRQQWRHLNADNVRQVERYQFPSDLYDIDDKTGVELALGTQYTTDRFSQFGVEYYYQSEGYSSSQWKQQTGLVSFLNQRTGYAPLDNAFDAYKYLMASEIYNTGSKGSLQGKHYLNTWASVLMDDAATLQPYAVMNLVDGSAMLGLNYTRPLEQLDKQLEIYTGVYTAVGSKQSEFGLFGDSVGTYAGFKYHF